MEHTTSDENKIEAMYYLMTDTRRYVEGISEEDDLRQSVRDHGKIILDRPLTDDETQTIIDNS